MRSSLSRYTLLIKRWIWIVVLGISICGSATFIVTKLMLPTYQATTLIILSMEASQSPYDNTTASLEILPTYAQLLTTPKVLAPVAAQHGLTIKQLMTMVTIKPQSNTQIIEVDVENGNPQLAMQIANQIAQSFAQLSSIQLGNVVQTQILPAVVPVDPIHPRPLQDALIGALAGFGLALALIVIFEWVDDRLTSSEEINDLLGVDALTTIPRLRRRQWARKTKKTPAQTEGCRMLCATINNAHTTQPFKTLMVTSPFANEGKSTIAVNIASFLAQSGQKVLLVDANFRNPVLDQHFQLSNRNGLSHALLEIETQQQAERLGSPTEIPSLRVLTAGTLPTNPPELLQSYLAQQLFQHFNNSAYFDYIIFDTPPVLPIADAQILASYIEATILVVDTSKTSRQAIVRAKQRLSRTGTRILGVVLNKSRWSDYGEVREYLSHIPKKTRANLAIPLPPNRTSLADTSTEAKETTEPQPANQR